MIRHLLAASLLVPILCCAAPTEVRAWRHDTGDSEMAAGTAAVARFNASQPRWKVVIEAIPQGSYAQAINAASMVGGLPCLMTMDQPTVPNFAWAGHVRPLDDLLPAATLRPLLPGALGSYRGKVYSVGQFDVALVLFARRSALAALGARVATMDQPYSAAEFREILARARSGHYRFPLDVDGRSKGEWLSYAFGPWLQSAGADLIDRNGYTRVDGVLNSTSAVTVGRYFGKLFGDKLAERNPADDQSFKQGRALFHYTGSWAAPLYMKAFGADLVAMPPPDFGHGPKIGAGSWQWGITRSCQAPLGAAAFLAFLLDPKEMAAMSDATGLIPMSEASAALTANYRVGGPSRIFYQFAERYAVTRPATPLYPALSSVFEKAMLDIRSGKDAAEALDEAVEAIEYNLARNKGYGLGAQLTGAVK